MSGMMQGLMNDVFDFDGSSRAAAQRAEAARRQFEETQRQAAVVAAEAAWAEKVRLAREAWERAESERRRIDDGKLKDVMDLLDISSGTDFFSDANVVDLRDTTLDDADRRWLENQKKIREERLLSKSPVVANVASPDDAPNPLPPTARVESGVNPVALLQPGSTGKELSSQNGAVVFGLRAPDATAGMGDSGMAEHAQWYHETERKLAAKRDELIKNGTPPEQARKEIADELKRLSQEEASRRIATGKGLDTAGTASNRFQWSSRARDYQSQDNAFIRIKGNDVYYSKEAVNYLKRHPDMREDIDGFVRANAQSGKDLSLELTEKPEGWKKWFGGKARRFSGWGGGAVRG